MGLVHLSSTRPAAPAYRVVALEGRERVDAGQWRRVAHPLQCLPVGDDEHVLHRVDRVQELYESFLVVRLREPGCVVVQSERCPVGRVVPLEVLHDHLVHALGLGRIGAGVTHRTATTVQILPHHHRNFPNTYKISNISKVLLTLLLKRKSDSHLLPG